MIEIPFHPLAEIFPLMTDAELKGLTADIEEHGQLEVIVTLDGAILDGRNRYRACQDLGIEPKVVEWSGVGSAQAFVVSHNLHRRHLNESQRAFIAAKLANARRGQRTDLQPSANLQDVENNKQKQPHTPIITKTDAAKMMNVGGRSVSHAAKVLKHGTPEEIAAVESGEASAATISKQISKNIPPEKRALHGHNSQDKRIETLRMNGQIWALFRDAVKNLTALPHTDDMIRIVKGNDKAHLTDAKLSIALNYLTEFSNAWNGSNGK